MAWSTLSAADMLNALTAPERDLFGSGDSASTSPDRLTAIISWVVDQVRGKVAALPENRGVMGASGTLPPELYGAAIAIARYTLLTSFPAGRMFLDDARTRAYTDALKQLDDAAEGKLIVEPGTTTTFTANASAFGSRDDYLSDPTKRKNRNVEDFGFWN
jgi:hypothetical protein